MLIICMLVARAQAACRHLQPHAHTLLHVCVCVFITNMFWPSIRNTFTGLSLAQVQQARVVSQFRATFVGNVLLAFVF